MTMPNKTTSTDHPVALVGRASARRSTAAPNSHNCVLKHALLLEQI
jgi:hypothetical protein